MILQKPPIGSVLDFQVNFGDDTRSWRQILEQDPMVPGQEAILPRFYMKDLFQYEVKNESLEEKEPR